MSQDKLEPRLVEYIEQKKTRAAAKGASHAAVQDEPIEVTISHVEDLRAEETRDRSSTLLDLGERIRTSQATIVNTLRRLKTAEPKRSCGYGDLH